jgi:hypothetical protein
MRWDRVCFEERSHHRPSFALRCSLRHFRCSSDLEAGEWNAPSAYREATQRCRMRMVRFLQRRRHDGMMYYLPIWFQAIKGVSAL